jgi:hypothetical protein
MVIAVLAACSLAACSEKEQQPGGWKEPGAQTDSWRQQLRDRGQAQNESYRIGD